MYLYWECFDFSWMFFFSLCVQLLDCFDYFGHICLSFTMLGLSVYDFLVSILQYTNFYNQSTVRLVSISVELVSLSLALLRTGDSWWHGLCIIRVLTKGDEFDSLWLLQKRFVKRRRRNQAKCAELRRSKVLRWHFASEEEFREFSLDVHWISVQRN